VHSLLARFRTKLEPDREVQMREHAHINEVGGTTVKDVQDECYHAQDSSSRGTTMQAVEVEREQWWRAD
jgi:hypothetical protein